MWQSFVRRTSERVRLFIIKKNYFFSSLFPDAINYWRNDHRFPPCSHVKSLFTIAFPGRISIADTDWFTAFPCRVPSTSVSTSRRQCISSAPHSIMNSLLPPRVLPRYQVWNWLVAIQLSSWWSPPSRQIPAAQADFIRLSCMLRSSSSGADSFYSSWFQPTGKNCRIKKHRCYHIWWDFRCELKCSYVQSYLLYCYSAYKQNDLNLISYIISARTIENN